MNAVNRWFDGLSNWQYVAVAMSFGILIFLVAGCVIVLTGPLRVRPFVTVSVFDLVVIVGLSAWKRWK